MYHAHTHAYARTRHEFDYYIFAEDDYLPARAHFDALLVRMYADTFGERPGVLAGLVQGGAVEPESSFALHLETSHYRCTGTAGERSHTQWPKEGGVHTSSRGVHTPGVHTAEQVFTQCSQCSHTTLPSFA